MRYGKTLGYSGGITGAVKVRFSPDRRIVDFYLNMEQDLDPVQFSLVRSTAAHHLRSSYGFVAQIGLRVSFPFPQTDSAYCLCDR
jgi:hypothetical protein